MKKFHISIVGIIIILALLFFITPVQTQNNAIESLRKSSKTFALIADNVSLSVVFMHVKERSQHVFKYHFPMPFYKEGRQHYVVLT